MIATKLSLYALSIGGGALFVDAAVKSTLVLAAAGFTAWMLRRRSAALQHGVWTAGFVVCAALPAIALVAPAWHLSMLPNAPQWNEQTNLLNSGPLAAHASPPVAHGERPPTVLAARPSRSIGQSQPSDASTQEVTPPPASRQRDPIAAPAPPSSPPSPTTSANVPSAWQRAATLAFFSWLAGVALLCLRGVWRLGNLRRFLAGCRPIEDHPTMESLRTAASRLGFRGRVKLLESPTADGPLTVGVTAAAIVLPADARTWTDERRDMVLLHELAHAKRRDVTTQTIAAVVCTLHWFNPFAWRGLSQMRRLRELACDDVVVAAGQRPSDYAAVLLQVARSYRHGQRALAVGMARGSNVEARIFAILDRARNRVALSPRAFGLLLASTIAASMAIGTVSLQSRADDSTKAPAADSSTSSTPSEAPTTDKAKTSQDDASKANSPSKPQLPDDPTGKTLEVVVTDVTGAPIEGANVKANVFGLPGAPTYPTWDYTTDSAGVAYVKRPDKVNLLRLWPEKRGYVTQFVNFVERNSDEEIKVPDRYEFRLDQATEISGVVVDDAGRPIKGVAVHAQIKFEGTKWGENPKPIISNWVHDAGHTDKEGKWTILGVPAAPSEGDDLEFSLKFQHDDYISDANYGELQRANSVTSAQLRDGTAKVVMQQGVPIKGIIENSAGQPVTKGVVIWSDNTYFAEGVNECQIGEDGRFETPPFEPGKRWLTVLAPGYAPDRREVTLRRGMAAEDFTLKPGQRLAFKVVDQEGKPVPNAYVGIGPWRGANAIYNEKHPNVPESHIPRHADDQGVYIWDWAPEDAVTYNVSAKGLAATSVTLAAKPSGEPHIVELAKPLVASGKVTDASTGQPIREFAVAPVIEFRPDHLSSRLDYLASASDGAYELPLRGGGSDSYRYRVRIEADGYRSQVSERSFGTRDGRVAQDFALEPAPARQGRVVDAAGNPVAGAIVVEATRSIAPSISRNKVGHGDRQIETDSDGRFKFHATTEKYLLRILHDSAGFAELVREPDEPIGTIALQPWAKVSGQVIQQGKPVPNTLVIVHPLVTPQLGEPRIQGNYQTQTDGEGRFKFDRVAPTQYSVRAYLGPWQDSPLTSSQSEPLDLQPAEERSVNLGGEGATIAGRIVATGRDNAQLDKNWSLSYLISRDRGIPLPANFPELSFDPAQPVESNWFLDPASDDWRASRTSYFVKPTPAGDIQINGVSPGTYDLVLRLYEQPAGCLVETIGEKVVTIEVTAADAAAGLKEIGEIEVPCRSGPRVGQSMAAFKFIDATGREIDVDDLKGRYVLMHAWASWCGPCLATMPDLKATVRRLSEKPLTVVGLNLDQEADAGKRLVEREELAWAQNYLGDDSDLAKQLAISSVPAYYLVGPDGTLAASSTEWGEIKERLEAALAD